MYQLFADTLGLFSSDEQKEYRQQVVQGRIESSDDNPGDNVVHESHKLPAWSSV